MCRQVRGWSAAGTNSMRHGSMHELPKQLRATAQIMHYWMQHRAIEDKLPTARCAQMLSLR